MRVRVSFTIDITRDRDPGPESERPPVVDVKGSYILERAPEPDPSFEPDRPIGFQREEDRP